MRKVLIVDDSAMIRRQVASVLRTAGYEVLEAADGKEAHDTVCATADIGAIVLDVSMPRMNGLELLDALHREGFPGSIVMLTTEARPEAFARARALGAKAWLVKPLKPALLLAAIERLVN